MSIAKVEHERVEIVIDVVWSGDDTWYSWSVKTPQYSLTGSADSFNQSLRMIRKRLSKLRSLAEDILDR